MLTTAIIATLDTKGEEAQFLVEQMRAFGCGTILIDSGMRALPAAAPDISREEVLKNAGVTDIETFQKQEKSAMIRDMILGLCRTLRKLYETGKIDGVLSIGGGQGSALSTAAMQALPLGFPKVMISTVACGTAMFGDYVGNKDIAMLPTICDACGLNSVTIPIFSSGCGAVYGMMKAAERVRPESRRKVIALTMAGVTTPCVMEVKRLLDERDYETIVFHCNGVGATLLDELASEGKLDAVLDITPHDVGGMLFDGLMKCGPERFRNVYKSGIPVLNVPGGEDFILSSPKPHMREELLDRAQYMHTPFHIHVRTSYEEMYRVGRYTGEKLAGAAGRTAVVVPLRGYSQNNMPGGVLYNERANQGYVDGVQETKSEATALCCFDMHINDKAFAQKIVDVFETLL
ncbi:MAG: Tm-1-like ATP-binding domain-containing protein [Oscillospiraceae bacterium]